MTEDYAFTGAEPIAAGLELASLTLMGLKVYSQWQRGDNTGAAVTSIATANSLATGQISRVVRVGGRAQEHFNSGVASALGNASGKGLEAGFSCE